MRFPEFKENWKITTLGECSSKLEYGLGASAIEYDGIHKYIRITDIDDSTNQFNSSNLTSPSFFDDNYKVKQNDILFARTGASVGKTYHYDDSDGNLYYAGFLIAAHILKEINSKFVFYNTLSNNYKNWVQIMSARSGQPGINAEEYSNYKFNIPTKEEQDRIVLLMEKIDKKIQTQIKIINNLLSQKNHIINMLTENKSREFYISDLMEIGRGRVISSNEINKDYGNNYPVYSSQTSNNGIMGYLSTYDYDGEYITWTTDGANAGTVYYRKGKFNCTNVCGILKAKKHNIDLFYISKILSLCTKKYVSTNLANPKLMNNVMANIKIPVPSLDVQRNCSMKIKSLEEKIYIENLILEKYQIQKQYLLKNMFI